MSEYLQSMIASSPQNTQIEGGQEDVEPVLTSSYLDKNGWAKHGYIRTFPGPSACGCWSVFRTRNRASYPSPSPQLGSVCQSLRRTLKLVLLNGKTHSLKH